MALGVTWQDEVKPLGTFDARLIGATSGGLLKASNRYRASA